MLPSGQSGIHFFPGAGEKQKIECIGGGIIYRMSGLERSKKRCTGW